MYTSMNMKLFVKRLANVKWKVKLYKGRMRSSEDKSRQRRGIAGVYSFTARTALTSSPNPLNRLLRIIQYATSTLFSWHSVQNVYYLLDPSFDGVTSFLLFIPSEWRSSIIPDRWAGEDRCCCRRRGDEPGQVRGRPVWCDLRQTTLWTLIICWKVWSRSQHLTLPPNISMSQSELLYQFIGLKNKCHVPKLLPHNLRIKTILRFKETIRSYALARLSRPLSTTARALLLRVNVQLGNYCTVCVYIFTYISITGKGRVLVLDNTYIVKLLFALCFTTF